MYMLFMKHTTGARVCFSARTKNKAYARRDETLTYWPETIWELRDSTGTCDSNHQTHIMWEGSIWEGML